MRERPNVLLFITDQQRPDTLGFRGETPCRTPNIDGIAAQGVSFDRAITPCPLCLPSRASLFTGLYPSQNDMMDNSTSQLSSCQMLDHFRDAGYRVDYAGKWHMGEGNIGAFTDRHAGDSTAQYSAWCADQGLIDGWMFNDPKTRTWRTPSMSIPKVHVQDLPVDKTNEASIADAAIDMIGTRDREAPFFQVCSFNGPHPPFMIPEPYFSMYDRAEVAEPDNFGPQADEPRAIRTSFYRLMFADHGTDFDDWRASYAVYWGFVTMVDHMVGRVMAALEREGLRDDTIVVFISDHGENLGAHGLWQKMVPYDQSIRVPFLMSVPGAGQTGIRNTDPVSLIDLAPTLAGLCGLPGLDEWRGVDLYAQAGGERASQAKRPLFAMHRPLGDWMSATDWRMVEQDRLKYTWNRGDTDQLFDLADDPGEVNNLIGDPSYRSRLQALRSLLADFMRSTGDPLMEAWPGGETRSA
jgi:arylsulfatase A-like enzyme